ncbi:MAG TPA: MBL fold metallo-hydrolase [Bryobacteraceae bacterium]|jgi:glyoxylase-like metal-dependent hydrolase (beta-lactamase superfamily II)|nr:MBL fold metallo-hydrolase [Bryobacteraceae bacterium]
MMLLKHSGFLPFLALSLSAPVFGQGQIAALDFAGRTGQPAGIDLSGAWFPNPGQDSGLITASGALVEYGGIPMNEAGRLYALAWSAARIQGRQHQCMGYVPPYTYNQPGHLRFWEERDPFTQRLLAIKMYWQISEGLRTIWMDDRPHPPAYAQHSWAGFATAKYEGNTLTVSTTHLKRGWIRANGIPQSDEATVSEHFIRHGDRITYLAVVNDPVYLTEPFSRTYTLLRNAREPDNWLYACDDGEQILNRKEDQVEAYAWGQHPFLREFADKHQIPLLGALGGAETMYPEFAAKMKDSAAMERAIKAELTPSSGPPHASRALDPDPQDGEIHVLPVQGNLYMLVGDGGNIAVQVGEQGALVVDTGAGKLSEKVIAAIRKLSEKPVQFIVNSSYHADRTGGNGKLRAAGFDPSVVGSFFSGQFADAGQGATIIAQQNVQNRMQSMKTEAQGWPSDTFLKARRRKFHNGEAVEILYQPNAMTDGDSIVHFRRSDVIATGDIFSTTSYPSIDVKAGGSIQGEIEALNTILERTVYQHDEEGGTLIIPGHGRVCDEWEVAEYRDMLVIIRDRARVLIDRGATLQQVKAQRITADYDDRFGANSGSWTTDMFVEAVYTSLKNPPKTGGRG